MDDDRLPNARPIALSDSPRCQRSQSSVFSAAVKPRKYPRPIAVHSFPFQDRVLRRPIETTALSGHQDGIADRLMVQGIVPQAMTVAEFEAFVKSESKKFGRITKAANIEVQN